MTAPLLGARGMGEGAASNAEMATDATSATPAEESPKLDEREQRQAAERAAPGPLVIHEIIRAEGEHELQRTFNGLALSGLAAGLSIGFSFLAQAYIQSYLPDAPWRRLISSFGYTVGFLIVILGRQQLFTETTLTALIPALSRRDGPTFRATLRVWSIVLGANLAGTFVFAFMASRPGLFDRAAAEAMGRIAGDLLDLPFWAATGRAVAAGWLIGLMVWLLPAAGSGRPILIMLLTYTIAMCAFPHIIAGSVEAAYAVFTGAAAPVEYVVKFFVPTCLGNVFGGAALAAVLNHAPISAEVKD